MIKTLLQQLEDWFANGELLAVERTLGGLPVDKFSLRMWEIYVHTLLRLARDHGHDTVRYSRALNCMHYMMEEQVERFVHLYYYYAYALAHLDRESEALLFLTAYFEEVVPAFQHPDAVSLERECLQRISMPQFRLGSFVDRCHEMGEALQSIAASVTSLVQEVAELADATSSLAVHRREAAQQEVEQLLYKVARPLMYQLRFTAVWRDNHVVLELSLDGIAQNIHLLHALLQHLRPYLPQDWEIALPTWHDFVKEHYPEEPDNSSLTQLLLLERDYTTTLPPETSIYEPHLQLNNGWTQQPMVVYEYLQDENFVFNLFRLSGCFCGFIAYNAGVFIPYQPLAPQVRDFNHQLATAVQETLGDASLVAFVGGGYGASAFERHAMTAYCDFIAFDPPRVLAAIAAFFEAQPECAAQVQAFHRAASPFVV